MEIKEKQKLKRFIRTLSLIRGRHTELVSVYIPAGYELHKIINHLEQEKGTATNIKDAKTRKHVIASLEKIIRHLRLFKKTPENGLAAFAGNASEKESQVDIKIWSVEPPEPLNLRIYRCDQAFLLDPLRQFIETKDMHGLIVLDRREATIGVLKGHSIRTLSHSTSGVPGKTRAGGQCHVFGTLIQTATGDIIKIENSHNPIKLKSLDIKNYSLKDSNITDKWNTKKQEVYKIITKYPRLEVESSKDHLFFVLTEKGIIEKPAEELKKEDILLTPEKINIKGKLKKLDSKKYYNSFTINKKGRELLKKKREEKSLFQKKLAKQIGITQTAISVYELGKRNTSSLILKKLCKKLNINFKEFIEKYTFPYKYKNIKLPTQLNNEFAQFLGYYMGDGCSEKDRIIFFEQDKQVALDYQEKYNKFLEISSSYKFRESKNYHQIKFTSRPLVRLIKNEFPELKKTLDSEVPKKILESPDSIVASFLKGFFDAEGYIKSREYVGIASNNKTVIGQIQLMLLRFGIITSFIEYDNKKNPYTDNPIFKLQINEKQSILNYKKYIGFTSNKKSKRLNILVKSKSNISKVRQILLPGEQIRKIIENAGLNLEYFPKVSNFFYNQRMISKQAFKKSILKNIKDKKLYEQLEKISNYAVLPTKIHKIIKTNKTTKMIDISVKNHNFLANGLLVHNSAMRYERLREGAAKEFFKRVSETVNKEFLGKKQIKGILIGGPGHTKEEFKEYLNTEIKNKIIAVKDLTYTDESGLHDLVSLSQDALAKEQITHEKELLENFLTLLAKEPEKVAYGETEVKKALEYSAAKTLLLSEDLPDEQIEEFEQLAEKTRTEIEIISAETREGQQLKDLGGIAAILRFAIQ